ncbi:TIGR01440 family protein [Paucilactobacillus kaifaensis]|uniref:TIGR01440 family protein n=1 Tax=Paucilactobacillus kaifaensis TaxID=2559921 RepID=UPI0010F8A571|nr:TIGR01440 family protein [Paucilactobacillus kaifaensis]
MEEFNLALAKQQLQQGVNEFLDQAEFAPDSLIVLGSSTSEVQGKTIGKDSSIAVGKMIVEVVFNAIKDRNLHLAIQGCEHINRSLLMERIEADKRGFEQVTVVPALHAGGATQVAAYEQFDDPVEVEHIIAAGGIDLGDTSIGMHVKFVQIPVRTTIKEVGFAHVTYLRSRPKLVGGQRAQYEWHSNGI